MQIVDHIQTDELKETASKLDLWFWGEENAKYLLYEQNIMGMKTQILIQNLDNHPDLTVTENCFIIDSFRVPRSRGSIAELDHFLRYIEELQAGHASVHAACVTNDEKTLLLAAYPNVGKTSSCNQLLKDGWKYLSDDTVVYDEKGRAYLTSFPSAIGFYDFLQFVTPEHINGRWNYFRLYLRGRLHESCELTKHLIKPPLIELAQFFETANEAKVTDVCTLEIGPKKIQEIDLESMMARIQNINLYSIPQLINNPMLKVYEYFNPTTFSIAKYRAMESCILHKFLVNVRTRGGHFHTLACNDWDWLGILEEAGLL